MRVGGILAPKIGKIFDVGLGLIECGRRHP
jgi:hypothetical protein